MGTVRIYATRHYSSQRTSCRFRARRGERSRVPATYLHYPFNFQGFVGRNEDVRFHLQIEAVNFISAIYVVEVSWDGQWSYVPAEMKQHLPIRIVPSPTT
jgi:hypothetical protein